MKVKNDSFYLYKNNTREHGNNELVFGKHGQGQTLFVKQELRQFVTNQANNEKEHSQILVIDTCGEFLPISNVAQGSIISVKNSGVDIFEKCVFIPEHKQFCSWGDKKNMAFDFTITLCEQSYRKTLAAYEKSIIYNIVCQMYDDNDTAPTISAFYNELARLNNSVDINGIRRYIKPLCLLGNKTKEQIENKFIVYDLHDFSKTYIGAAYIYCLLDVYQHIVENYQNGIKTYVYMDNIYNLFLFESSAYILSHMWIQARMLGASFLGVCNDINVFKTMQGLKILMSTSNVCVFRLEIDDCISLKELFCLSDEDVSLILNLSPGNGLLIRDECVSLF